YFENAGSHGLRSFEILILGAEYHEFEKQLYRRFLVALVEVSPNESFLLGYVFHRFVHSIFGYGLLPNFARKLVCAINRNNASNCAICVETAFSGRILPGE